MNCIKQHGMEEETKRFIIWKRNATFQMAVEVFTKTRKHAGLVVTPITFSKGGQVDLIGYQSWADGKFKWFQYYQDHVNKFLYLRPLKTKRVAKIAMELFQMFLEQGAPVILQSDHGQ